MPKPGPQGPGFFGGWDLIRTLTSAPGRRAGWSKAQGLTSDSRDYRPAARVTTTRRLSTFSKQAPTAGQAWVGGFDVVREAGRVREIIGLTGQYASVDEKLTGRENLILIGRLLGLKRAESKARADALLTDFSLEEAGRRPAQTYSGGIRRRLDLAASLVGHPRILFLDEPSTGLDPGLLPAVLRSLDVTGIEVAELGLRGLAGRLPGIRAARGDRDEHDVRHGLCLVH